MQAFLENIDFNQMFEALMETLFMTGVSLIVAVIIGLILGILIYFFLCNCMSKFIHNNHIIRRKKIESINYL